MRAARRPTRRSRLSRIQPPLDGIIVLLALFVALLLCARLILAPTEAAASTQSELDSFLREWEMQLQTTAPGFYQGQQRGYITGGAVNLRFPSRNFVPLTLSMPSLRAGCGGISFFGGAFSYINGEQFTQFLQNIAQNAVGMAFQLALQTLCPQCATALAKMEEIVRNMTGFLGNSCQAAKALVRGIASSDIVKEISHKTCTEINTALGVTEDFWSSNFKCPPAPEQKKADLLQAIQDALNPTQEPQRISQNIFWSAYNRLEGLNPFWDTPHGQYLMSLFGTIVLNYKSDDPKADPELAPWAHTLEVTNLLAGWEDNGVQILQCTDDTINCLSVSPVAAPAFEGFEATVEEKLREYADRLERRTPANPEPILRANVAGVPIARLLQMVSGVPGGAEEVISVSKRLVAIDLLRDVIMKTARLVRQEARKGKDRGFMRDYIRDLDRRILAINTALDRERRTVTDSTTMLTALARLAREAQAQRAPSLIGNLGFAGSLTNLLGGR